MPVKLIISDFDGTLVDTYKANYLAYMEVLDFYGINLSEESYRRHFGLRFDDFMTKLGIMDSGLRQEIRDKKSEAYIKHFDKLVVNTPLLELIRNHRRRSGGLTAIASTARKKNLHAALINIGALEDFDLILAGESVSRGKPNPEIYCKVLDHFGLSPDDAIVFEDSNAGITAAETAGIRTIRVTL